MNKNTHSPSKATRNTRKTSPAKTSSVKAERMAAMSVSMEAYVEKEYVETSSDRGWVNYGDDNLFPQYLSDLYMSSAVHSALVRSISTMVAGNGLESDTSEGQLSILELGIYKQYPKLAHDLKLQGGFYLEVKRDGNSKISKVSHIPFQEIRIGEKESNGDILGFYHCLDWSDGTCPVTPVAPFKSKGTPGSIQLMSCLPYVTGSNTYPHPDYMGAVNWIEVDKNTALFHNNNLANGLTPGLIINWKNGIPSPEKREALKDEMADNMSGVRNAGKFIMTFSDNEQGAPEFTPVPLPDAHNQYQFITDEATNKIMIGHRVVSPAMFGVRTSGSLGSTKELETAAMLFHHNVITHMQKYLTDCTERLLAANGIAGSVDITNDNPLLVDKEAINEESSKAVEVLSNLITRVNENKLTKKQATLLLTLQLGYSQEDANALFEPEVEVEVIEAPINPEITE